MRAAGRGFLTRPEGTNRPTIGIFRGAHVESGGREKSIAADLDHDPLRQPPVTFYQHVESKVAAQMRHQDLRNETLVVDNTVCGTNPRDQDYPWTCEKILPSLLPAGARLTVWVTRDGGQTWWQGVYVGTGERITR